MIDAMKAFDEIINNMPESEKHSNWLRKEPLAVCVLKELPAWMSFGNTSIFRIKA